MEYSAPEIYEMHAIIKGKVQGVGFRSLTRHNALNLGLVGTVRNLPNGHVEIYAQGSKKHLEDLIQCLKEETDPDQVKEVTIDYFPIETPHQDFLILH